MAKREKRAKRRPHVPFTGETMTCVVCGKVHESDIAIESNWRCVQVDGVSWYACPDEFPAGGASEEQFQAAYEAVFQAVLSARAKEIKGQ